MEEKALIIDEFKMNGDSWKVELVSPYDKRLVDRTHVLTVATTDPSSLTVYVSETLQGNFLMMVFIHELGHCAMYSFGLLEEIHRMAKPKYWIKMEEFICSFLADFGLSIFKTAYSTLGYNAWKLIPIELNKRIA